MNTQNTKVNRMTLRLCLEIIDTVTPYAVMFGGQTQLAGLMFSQLADIILTGEPEEVNEVFALINKIERRNLVRYAGEDPDKANHIMESYDDPEMQPDWAKLLKEG